MYVMASSFSQNKGTKSKDEDKEQESIQSNTTTVPRHHKY